MPSSAQYPEGHPHNVENNRKKIVLVCEGYGWKLIVFQQQTSMQFS
jgi:hypothetical protein